MARQVPKLSNEILEQASSWFIDLHESQHDTTDREQFTAWLRRSPEHVRAYLEISAIWEDAHALKSPGQAEIEALVARARAEQNVVPLDAVPSTEAAGPSESRSRFQYLAIAASIALVAIGAAVGAWVYDQRDVYATDIGEQRSITLEDGSTVELNSRSRLKVRFSDAERRIELVEGQALFRVAKNPARPFIVRSGDTSVRAVGTQFDVYRKSDGTMVTVLEGQVAVIPQALQSFLRKPEPSEKILRAAQPTSQFLVSAGEQVLITPVAAELPKPANIAIATAWTEQKLVFDETPLREVVEEFNRYNRRQLIIGDPQLYEFHVSGVFPSTDSSRMIEFLRQRFRVTVDESGQEIVILRGEQVSF